MLSKIQLLALGMGIFIVFILVTASQNATLSIDWNELVNGLLRDTIAVIFGAVLTIVIYRYIYHRRSKT